MHPQALLAGAAFMAGAMAASTAAVAENSIRQKVDLALVLLTDVSNSMDDREYSMVKEGYKAAFRDPEVIAAILSNSKGVAVTYVEFSGAGEFTIVRGWDVLSSSSSAQAFGDAIAVSPRTSAGNTALAVSLRRAAELLSPGEFGSARRIIDVASDEDSDQGKSAPVRDAVVASGITVNALPFINNRPIGTFDGHKSYASAQWGLQSTADFYRRDIIGGPGSFLIEVHDYAAFGEGLKRKLLRELISSPGVDDDSETFVLAD